MGLWLRQADSFFFQHNLNGTLEIKEEAVRRGMEDIVVATLTAMLEWRKHNNKAGFPKKA